MWTALLTGAMPWMTYASPWFFEALTFLLRFGYMGIVGLVSLVPFVRFVVWRTIPRVVTWLILGVALCWLFHLYAVPFREALRSVEIRRARIQSDYMQDCDGKDHDSPEFLSHCVQWEAYLNQDDVLLAHKIAVQHMYDRLWSTGSWLFGLGILVITLWSIAFEFWNRHHTRLYTHTKLT